MPGEYVQMSDNLKENHTTLKFLSKIFEIRNQDGSQMFKYNFNTMLWDWCGLGLPNVLGAMRVKYNTEQFGDFFIRAMEIELRKNTVPQQKIITPAYYG